MHRFLAGDALCNYPHPSQRTATAARGGMVATSQPLAAQAGLAVLQEGGNAVDAAVATAAALTVVEPTSNGIGGDTFSIIWKDNRLHGMMASGSAPSALSIERLKAEGIESMPRFGWTPVTVPGTPGGWEAMNRRFGRLPFEQVLAPAVRYASEGFPVSPVTARYWQRAAEVYGGVGNLPGLSEWFRVFTRDGRAPAAGEFWQLPDHARTLQMIGKRGSSVLYGGTLGEHVEKAAKLSGGFLSAADLGNFAVEWVDPISVNYHDYTIWELPPHVQGIVTLMALNVYSALNRKVVSSDVAVHYQIEALKRAFADGLAQITDREYMSIDPDYLLGREWTDRSSSCITSAAADPEPLKLPDGGTVYMAAADAEGCMVSCIQSNYMGFGSGIVIPGTGVAMQNRGHTFSLDPTHANALMPGKRTYHTIMPGFITQGDRAVGPFGVMGGFMQPQGHLQVLCNLIDNGMNPQAALDAPRWQWVEGRRLMIEETYDSGTVGFLEKAGHEITRFPVGSQFGRGQIILRDEEGTCFGGTDPRCDGTVAAY